MAAKPWAATVGVPRFASLAVVAAGAGAAFVAEAAAVGDAAAFAGVPSTFGVGLDAAPSWMRAGVGVTST
ncbi:MAG: hypothetical protein M5U18_02485 [Dehalococcoidia bacterium]|nr:hypothetical protein [Dehalococcoidia bacterium]